MRLSTNSVEAMVGLALVLPAVSALPQVQKLNRPVVAQVPEGQSFLEHYGPLAMMASGAVTALGTTAAVVWNHMRNVDDCLSHEVLLRDQFALEQAQRGNIWQSEVKLRKLYANALPAEATVDDVVQRCKDKGRKPNMAKKANQEFLKEQTSHCLEVHCEHMRLLNLVMYDECVETCGKRYAYTAPAKTSRWRMGQTEASQNTNRMPFMAEAVHGMERSARHLSPALSHAGGALEKEGAMLQRVAGRVE
ncbi:MAG: hypothetical protein M1826_006960 [Phylliscum demangeonii]|nr:MAG: hypothetical protein M1826_006960 [Phylliscum demangeonii]